MMGRADGTASGQENAVGTTPTYADLDWTGLDFSAAQYEQVTGFDRAAWATELGLHTELFQQLAHHLPAEMNSTKARIEERLAV
jgi:phosphoenolpyruvate carboxykinase (GTP)